MPLTEVGLAQRGPWMFPDAETGEHRIVGEDQLPITTASNIDLDRVGHPGRGVEAGQGVVGVSGRPTPMADHRDSVCGARRHHLDPFGRKPFTGDEADVIVRAGKPPFPGIFVLTERL
jgi:hypothetical protein